MNIPRVNPVGILERPPDYTSAPRAYSPGLRLAAIIILGAFVLVSVATTVHSLGVYCLTSHAGIPTPFVM